MNTKEIARQESPSSLLRWDPLKEFRALSAMPEMFEDLFWGFPTLRMPELPGVFSPKVNIQETEKEYHISAALPGIKKEDVKIKVQDGVLTISGDYKEEKEEKNKSYLKREMSYGSFQRSFILPAGTHPEDVKACHKDGILTLTLPKPAQEKARGVNIKVD